MKKRKNGITTFKPKYIDKDGKTKEVSKWWIELRDHKDRVRRFAGFTDENETKLLGQQIVRLISRRAAGERPDKEQICWLKNTSEKLFDKLIKFDILDRKYAAVRKPLTTHIRDFEDSLLLTNGKDKHAGQVVRRVERIIEGCEFRTWSEIEDRTDEINDYIKGLQRKGLSKQTAQHYTKAFKQFARWMVRKRRAAPIPDDAIKTIKVPRSIERAFEFDEFRRLLKATKDSPERFGMAGFDRYVLYILAVDTGLRRGELQSLTPTSFDLNNRTVFVKGENTKNSDDAIQKISLSTSALLQDFVKGKMPKVQLFKIHDKSSKMIQADCEAAGIEVESNKGKLKFHSLRHTCGTFLAARGIHPKVIQDVMRHKDINLTMSRYTHTLRGQVEAAKAKMPDWTADESEAASETA